MRTLLALLTLVPGIASAASDLVMQDISATYDLAADQVRVTLTIKNQGVDWPNDFLVDAVVVQNGDWTVCADQVAHVVPRAALAPGRTTTAEWVLNGNEIDAPVYFFVDLDNSSVEANEGNNEGIAYFLPKDPKSPTVTKTWLVVSNPACLVNWVRAWLGIALPARTSMFYSKLRIL